MKNLSNNKIVLSIAVVVIIVVILVIYAFAHKATTEEMNADAVATTTDSSLASSTPEISVSSRPGQLLAYYLNIATTTFSQSENIPMTLFVYNLTNAPQELKFKDGCQATYAIGTFDMIKHIDCLPGATSFTIEPHAVRQIGLTHYASVYKIPVGKHDLMTSLVGYGGITTSVTITN
ncbi:MAG TPA: hypothetical protein VL335_01895 [Candidatus Paceibacterota bacterium]|nr:hypothetical protein [Candidatus Paceibacterota bacterium]